MLKTKPNKTVRQQQKQKPKGFRRVLGFFGSSNSREKRAGFDTLGGVYATEVCCDGFQNSTSTRSISSDNSEESAATWTSSSSPEHHKGAPLIVRRSVSQRHIDPNVPEVELGDEEILGRIMLKSRKLPKHCGEFQSNHVMINNERTKKYIPPLKRIPGMDEVAREHARMMAEENELFHTDPALLQEVLGRQCGRRIGANVTKGSSIEEIHAAMMESVGDRNNILDRRFTCMGMGTAKAQDGTLYLCQLFRD